MPMPASSDPAALPATLLASQSPHTPLSVIAGMAFTTTCCPLLLLLAPSFYSRHRNAIILLVSVPPGLAHPWGWP